MQNTEKNILMDDLSSSNVEIKKHQFDWIQKFEVDDFMNYSFDPGCGVKYLLIDEQYYVETNKFIKFGRFVRQPINMQGVEESSKILIEFNPIFNKVQIDTITVTRHGHTIDKLKTSDIQVLRREYKAESNILSGDRTLSIILEDIKVDDIIEFTYIIVNNNDTDVTFFSKQLVLEYEVPVFHINIVFIIMDNIEIQYKFLSEKFEIHKETFLNKKIYKMFRKNVSGKTVKQFIPYWYRPMSVLQVAVEKKWKDIASYMAKLYEIKSVEKELLNGLLDEIKIDALSNEKKVIRVLQYINKNIRYLSNFKSTDFVKPSEPNLIIKRGYGDCKDLAYLLSSILFNLGIQSYSVLVNTQYGKGLCDILPSPSGFNHVILLILIDDHKYFIDPTIRQNIELLKNIYLPDYGYGLICKDDTENLIYIKNKLPSFTHLSVKDEYQIISWKNKEAIFKSQITLRGEYALRLVQFREGQSETKFWEAMRIFYARFMNINEVIDTQLDITNISANEVTMNVKYRISARMLVEEKTRYTIEVIPIDIVEKICLNLPSEVNEDFYYGSPLKIDYCIDIVDPKIKFIGGREMLVLNEYFKLSKISRGREGGFLFDYQFERKAEVVPSEKYKEFYSEHAKAVSILPACIDNFKYTILNKSIFSGIIFFLIILFLLIVVK